MSLDVSLISKVRISYDDAEPVESEQYVYDANITHNLGVMARKAGIYEALWHPESIPAIRAHQIISILEEGLADMKARPEYFKQFDSPNGWGRYVDFVPFVEKYLEACKEYPKARIVTSV